MASIQSKTGISGKKTHYVVLCIQGKHKWIKAGSQKDAKILKRVYVFRQSGHLCLKVKTQFV